MRSAYKKKPAELRKDAPDFSMTWEAVLTEN